MDKKIRELDAAIRRGDALRENSFYPFTLSDGAGGLFELIIYDEESWDLAAYVGEEAIQRRLRSASADENSEIESMEALHSLDCLMLRFSRGESEFSRFELRRFPRQQKETEKGQMDQILSAALTFPAAVKPPKKRKIGHPAGTDPDALTAERIRNASCCGEKWIAHIFLHMESVRPEAGGDAFFPYVLMLLDERSGKILATGITADFDDYVGCFLSCFTGAVAEYGKPQTLIAVNERSRDFFKPLCAWAGIAFEKRSSSPQLKTALDSYAGFFLEQTDEEENELPSAREEEPADEPGWEEVNKILLQLVADPAALPRLSTELLQNLLEDMEQGGLDSAQMGLILNELDRRRRAQNGSA